MEGKGKVKAVKSVKPVKSGRDQESLLSLREITGEKLAVLELGGRQHLVREGSELTVSRLDLKEGAKEKTAATILKPAFGKGIVTYKLMEQKRGPKVLVMKYKAKSRYRRKRGFRADLSRVVVEKIELGK